MNKVTRTAPRGATRWRLLAATVAVALAGTVAPLATATPAAAATRCNEEGYFRLGDLSVLVCWVWGWVGTGTAFWRPSELHVYTTDSSKLYYVTVRTNPWKVPNIKELHGKKGTANWGVPASFNWTMTSGVESTTTDVARVIPGRDEACTARVRHERYDLFVMDVTGSC